MKINHNIPALRSNRSLNKNDKALSASLQKLSSGYKINKAADDSAGLAISRKMKTQIDALYQSSRNSADGISVLQTAEGALDEVTAMVQRMRELAVEAANDTYTMDDRKGIQDEIDQLSQEIDRLSEQTEYNTKNLLGGGLQRVNSADSTSIEVLSLSDEVLPSDYSFSIEEYGTKATASMGMAEDSLTEGASIEINGESIIFEAGASAELINEKIRDLCECVSVDWDMEGGTLSTCLAGSDQQIRISCTNALAELLGIDGDADGYKTTLNSEHGTDATLEIGEGFSESTTAVCKGNRVLITDTSGFSLEIELNPEAEDANEDVLLSVEDAGPMLVQVGANENQEVEIAIPKINSKTLGLDRVNIRSGLGATVALTYLDEALSKITDVRSKIGAYQNRLDSAIASLDTTGENVTHAMARVADTDMASEITEYTSKNVLVQAGESMLAQANSRPSNVLTMLQM